MRNLVDDRPRFSLIIPAHNEENFLPMLLHSVDEARARFSGGVEVIVVNNASTDDTNEIARKRGCRVVEEEKRVIASVRNRGALNAKGSVLAFIDADSRIHPDTFNAIDRALLTGKVIGGASGVKMDRMSLGLAVTYAIMYPLAWATGLDAGVVFCLREDFEKIGGYNEERLFAEDVQFLLELKKLGRSEGKKLTRIPTIRAITSTRKFDIHGDWHYLRMPFQVLLGLLLSRNSINEFAQKYWYANQRDRK